MSSKKRIKTVVVFCSSRLGRSKEEQEKDIKSAYELHAEELGHLLGQNKFNLVYGGGMAGLMGVVSKAAVEAGSKVTGIITHDFMKSAYYSPLPGSNDKSVRHLHVRKAQMVRKADACVVLFGGIGTLDEMWEVAALNDMKISARSEKHLTPIIVLNTNGIYNPMKELMLGMIGQGAIHPGREKMIRSVDTPQAVIQKLKTWSAEGVMRGCDLSPSEQEPVKQGMVPPDPKP